MSADILARREARRKKILENAENRLKRITGRSELHEKPGLPNYSFEENGCLSGTNEVLLNGTVKKTEADAAQYSSSRDGESSSYSDVLTTEHVNFGSSEIPVIDEISSVKVCNTYQPYHLIYLSTAILFRVLIEFNSQYIYNSIVVAFILIKCGVLYLHGWQIPESSRFVEGVLLLSGISPQKMRIFTVCTSIINSIVKDFALFTFVFVLSDMIMTELKHYL